MTDKMLYIKFIELEQKRLGVVLTHARRLPFVSYRAPETRSSSGYVEIK